MADYFLTNHARKRMAERAISKALLEMALYEPNKVLYDENEKIMFKVAYSKKGLKRMLVVVGKRENEILKILTVIDTTKIKL